jgi:hypothetical protein
VVEQDWWLTHDELVSGARQWAELAGAETDSDDEVTLDRSVYRGLCGQQLAGESADRVEVEMRRPVPN